MSPRQVVPDAQQQAFTRAMVERLGLDPSILEAATLRVSFNTIGSDTAVSVSLVAHLPTDEVLAMFNGVPS